MPAVTTISPEIKIQKKTVKQYSRGTKKRTCHEKSVHKAIHNVTSNNDKLKT